MAVRKRKAQPGCSSLLGMGGRDHLYAWSALHNVPALHRKMANRVRSLTRVSAYWETDFRNPKGAIIAFAVSTRSEATDTNEATFRLG